MASSQSVGRLSKALWKPYDAGTNNPELKLTHLILRWLDFLMVSSSRGVWVFFAQILNLFSLYEFKLKYKYEITIKMFFHGHMIQNGGWKNYKNRKNLTLKLIKTILGRRVDWILEIFDHIIRRTNAENFRTKHCFYQNLWHFAFLFKQ